MSVSQEKFFLVHIFLVTFYGGRIGVGCDVMKVEKIFPTNHVWPVKSSFDFWNVDGRIVKNCVSMSNLKTII